MKFTVGFLTGIATMAILSATMIVFHPPSGGMLAIAIVVSLVLNLSGRYVADRVRD